MQKEAIEMLVSSLVFSDVVTSGREPFNPIFITVILYLVPREIWLA